MLVGERGVDVFDEGDAFQCRKSPDTLVDVVGDLDVEVFLERHDQLDGVERIRAQVVNERCVGGHFFFFDTKLLNNNLFYAFFNTAHFQIIPYFEVRKTILIKIRTFR